MPVSDSNPQYGDGRPIVCEAASNKLRLLLNSRHWASRLGKLAELVIKSQIASYRKSTKADAQRFREINRRFHVSGWKGVRFGEDPRGDVEMVEKIADSKLRRRIWDWEKIPYATLCSGRFGAEFLADTAQRDVDEWVLRNETWLRLPGHRDWTSGLLKISHFPTIFPDARTSPSLILERRGKMPGFTFLDLKCDSELHVQSSVSGFAKTFEDLTGGILKGLDWNNVFVAGGIVLGTLLSPPGINASSKFAHSDIDLYIHGLGPVEATAKLREIFKVFKSNLPPGAPTFVVRNSKTITLYSSYPTKRVQIVLKLAPSPKDVLLNFDLDICAAGYDGKEVYMLPRTARALETGYNVFTMDLIQGHYLCERRASQEERVFKYADRGYGIRILPHYVEAFVERHDPDPPTAQQITSRDLGIIHFTAQKWVTRLINKYIKWGHTLYPPSAPQWPNPENHPNSSLEMRREFSHSMLESRIQMSSEPVGKRSCLSGFGLLMRHVALWELAVKGTIKLKSDVWATEEYRDVAQDGLSYDDPPKYPWDKHFTIDGFKYHLEQHEQTRAQTSRSMTIEAGIAIPEDFKKTRTSFSDDMEEVLDESHHIRMLLYLPKSLVEYVNKIVTEALADIGVNNPRNPLTPIGSISPEFSSTTAQDGRNAEEISIVAWTLDEVLMWQQLDRRIDETFEILWAFYRAFYRALRRPEVLNDSLLRFIKSHISQTAIRSSRSDDEKEEFEAFVRWVKRPPVRDVAAYGVMGQDWSHDDWADDDEDIDEMLERVWVSHREMEMETETETEDLGF